MNSIFKVAVAVFACSMLMAFHSDDHHRIDDFHISPEGARLGFQWNRGDYPPGARLEVFYGNALDGTWRLLQTLTVSDAMERADFEFGPDCLFTGSGFFRVHRFVDSDNDSISDAQEELEFNSNPHSLDSDFDTIPDEYEVAHGMNPAHFDSDNDGVTDEFELRYGTDPLCVDTDRDGLSDGRECYDYGTNPRAADTDADGLTDREEVEFGSDPRADYSIDARFPDRVMVLMLGCDPLLCYNDSTNRAWEHVFYTGDPLVPIYRPVSDRSQAVLDVTVSGSGAGRLLVGDSIYPLFGDGTDEKVTLQVPVPRNREMNVTLDIPPTLQVALDSEDFAYGSSLSQYMDTGTWRGYLTFPAVEVTVPCIHLLGRTRVAVELISPAIDKWMSVTWLPTDEIDVEMTSKNSAVLTGDIQRGTLEKVRYEIRHSLYQMGNRVFHQEVKYCPADLGEVHESEEDDFPLPDREEQFYEEEQVVEIDETLEYDEVTTYPRRRDVVKIHDPPEWMEVPLSVPHEAVHCCECPEHNRDFVELMTVSDKLQVMTQEGIPFTRIFADGSAFVTGTKPSQRVGDARLWFNRVGEVYEAHDCTVLGLEIKSPAADLTELNRLSSAMGLPVNVHRRKLFPAVGWFESDEPQGVDVSLVTHVGLPRGRLTLSLTDVDGHFRLWHCDHDTGRWELLLDSEYQAQQSWSLGEWVQRFETQTDWGEVRLRLTADTVGSAKIRFAYGALYNQEAICDLVEQKVTAVEPLLIFDVDQNGVIDESDKFAVRDGQVLRFWVNDDDDELEVEEGLADLPGAGENGRDAKVNGPRDLVDFTPLCIDLTDVFPRGCSQDYRRRVRWRLTSDSLNVLPTQLSRSAAGAFRLQNCGAIFGPTLSDTVLEAEVQDATAGIDLPSRLTETANIYDNGGIVLVEGRSCGDSLRLEGWLSVDGREILIGECQTRLRVSDVEAMYSWISLRPGEIPDSLPSLNPTNRPAFETSAVDDRNFVFVHGFNCNVQESRAWASEMFKRLWQAGLRAQFTAVDWRGDSSQFHSDVLDDNYAPDYYTNVSNAFAAAALLPGELVSISGGKVMIGHSLGNMLVSSAAVDYGLEYERYYMLNAAVPMEAYEGSTFASEMVDAEWLNMPKKFWASNWSQFFDIWDIRGQLSWKGRFAGLQAVVNCYSTTEDVLKNAEPGQLTYRGGVWKIQELAKGTTLWKDLEILTVGGLNVVSEGGWGINSEYSSNPLNYVYQYGFTERFGKSMTSETAITKPPFTPFKCETKRLHSLEPFWLNEIDDSAGLRARLLGDAIPATSFAQGANPAVNTGRVENVSMMQLADNIESWPEDRVGDSGHEWRHSDLKNLPYRHVHRLFERMVK